MVHDQDDVGGLVERVQPSRGAGEDERAHAERAQDPHRERHVADGMAFVVVRASVEQRGGPSGQRARHELPGVTLDGGDREVRDVAVRDGDRALHP